MPFQAILCLESCSKVTEVLTVLAAPTFDIILAAVHWWRARFLASRMMDDNMKDEISLEKGISYRPQTDRSSTPLLSSSGVPRIYDDSVDGESSLPLLKNQTPLPPIFCESLPPVSASKARVASVPNAPFVRRDKVIRTSGYRRHIMVIG